MGKKHNIDKFVNFLALSLAHEIGNIVNPDDLYTAKYKKESNAYLTRAKKASLMKNWNNYDKIKIKSQLRKKLKDELERKPFLDNRKFEIMDEEIEKVLKSLDLL